MIRRLDLLHEMTQTVSWGKKQVQQDLATPNTGFFIVWQPYLFLSMPIFKCLDLDTLSSVYSGMTMRLDDASIVLPNLLSVVILFL